MLMMAEGAKLAPRRRTAIIGAGAAGLSAAKHLSEVGCDVIIYEKGSHVGGLWVLDNDSGLSSTYKTLHINTDKYITQFSDFPLPEVASFFPHHTEIRSYLGAFADRFSLRDRVRFNTEVTKVSPVGTNENVRWQVTDSHGATETYDTVVVANGHLWSPRFPQLKGEFTGQLLHSHYYRDPVDFVGKRVCIIGAGNSACDIAADICVTAARTVMAVRSGATILPKLIFGIPTTQITTKLARPWIPIAFTRWVNKLITKVVHGKLSQVGSADPNHITHPTSNATLISHIAYRRVSVKPGIEKVEGKTIVFTDGSSEDFDVLIPATGYRIALPMIDPNLFAWRDDWAPLYKRVVPVDLPGLYFVGLLGYVGPLFKAFEAQSRWIAEIESGKAVLPSREAMLKDIANKVDYNRKRFHHSTRHSLEEEGLPYQREIRKEIEAGRQRARKLQHAHGGGLPPALAAARSCEQRQLINRA
jgi:dimethylaniline monooxygenase (N-oxide forming)